MARAKGLPGRMPQDSTCDRRVMDSRAEGAFATAVSIWSTRSSTERSKIDWTRAFLSAK